MIALFFLANVALGIALGALAFGYGGVFLMVSGLGLVLAAVAAALSISSREPEAAVIPAE